MRIIGGRDYYDGAGYGVDTSTTFIRKPRLTLLTNTPLHYTHREVPGYNLHRFDVVVAGEVYCGLCVAPKHIWPQTQQPVYFIYDQTTATTFSENINSYYRENFCDLTISDARRKTIREWALDNKVVTAIAGAEERQINDYNRIPYALFDFYTRNTSALINSDELKSIKFYSVMPPTQAHHAISSWVGGVLPYNAPTVEISDKSKIVKAGFDLRTSFRKMKA